LEEIIPVGTLKKERK